jgi:cytochrome c peroxidase
LTKRAINAVFGGVLAVGVGLMSAVAAYGGSAGAKVGLGGVMDTYRRPAVVPAPADNPTTPEKVVLGQKLFFDPRLSGSGAISCGTCHNPSLGWEDGLPTGVGHMGSKLGRHTPTILNVAWAEPLFWDGRAATLEEQAKGPLQSPAEMNMPHGDVVSSVKAAPGYRDSFAAVFPGEEISIDTIAKAIAAYERTVVSGDAPFDRWINGDENAISEEAKRGFVTFNGKAKCATCHSGWRFTDDGFHDIGLKGDDMGRAKLVPGLTILERAFKTPTLRNIVERAPYMHDGSIATLEAVVDHYDSGFVSRPSLSTDVQLLKLTAQEKSDLVAFMKTLSSQDRQVALPSLPPR